MEQDDLQNLITWKGAGELAKKAHGAGLFQNLEQDELQNLITWKGAGKLAGKAGKAYLTGGLFQNLEQDELQNLIRADTVEKAITDTTTVVKDASSLVDALKNFGKLQNLD